MTLLDMLGLIAYPSCLFHPISPLARRSKAWGSEVDDKGVNEDDRFVRRGKPGAAGGTAALADHRDTQRVGAGSRGAWAVLGARLETEAEAAAVAKPEAEAEVMTEPKAEAHVEEARPEVAGPTAEEGGKKEKQADRKEKGQERGDRASAEKASGGGRRGRERRKRRAKEGAREEKQPGGWPHIHVLL